MRCMERNKSKLYYANPSSSAATEILDDDGYKTGNFSKTYDSPAEIWLCVMPKGGEDTMNVFGEKTDYSKVVVCDGPSNCPITEDSHIWADGILSTADHNYEVSKVAKTLNSVLIAIKEVTVSG